MLRQNAIAISALIVSVSALFVSISEVNTMQVEQKAAVYPHLYVGTSYNSEGFRILIKNNGTGLAFIESVQVYYQDHYFGSWPEVFDFAFPDGHDLGYHNIFSSYIRDRVMPPGESVEILGVSWNEETRFLDEFCRSLEVEICYRSMLKDQWVIKKSARRPLSQTCEVIPDKEFERN